MSNFLKNHPQISGLSKNKMIGALVILFAIVFIGMMVGIFNDNSDDKPKNDLADTKFNMKDNDAAINQIINNANIDKAKIAASEISKFNKNSASTPEVTINIPPIEKKVVPLKNYDAENGKDQYHKKLQENKYSSYTAKSLMFGKPLMTNQNSNVTIKSNASDEATNSVNNTTINKPNYPTSSTDLVDGGFKINSNVMGLGGTSNNSDDQNMQNEKRNFVKSQDTSDKYYLGSKLMIAKSPYEVKAGSVIPATMISGLNSDLPGQVVAQVRQNVYDSATRRYLLIPQGAKLIGLYDSNIAYGQERVLVIWTRLIYPNGDSINLKGMPGTDLEGYAGFHDIVDNKYWKIFGTSFVMGVITGAMQYSQNNTNPNVQVGGLGLSSSPSVSQTMAGSLGQQLGQTGLSIAQKNLNVQPTLIIKPNYPFTLMITSDIILKPYSMIQ